MKKLIIGAAFKLYYHLDQAMKLKIISIAIIILFPVIHLQSQNYKSGDPQGDNWQRTKEIRDCLPRLLDRVDLVQDSFEHQYITNNPREIEISYFSVEPITYFEEGNKFCEVFLPAVGVSSSYFRGTYKTSYTLAGNGLYEINIGSNALIYNNEIRIINAQPTLAKIEASHRVQILADTSLNPHNLIDNNSSTLVVYTWEVEIDEKGMYKGNSCEGKCNTQDEKIPGGHSSIYLYQEVRGPGVFVIEESVIFQMQTLSAFKYGPGFQAVSFFNLEPLSISVKLLPCK
ncbi:MAG: hypothetical protein MUO54_09075 [Anaerolineales bacterium]|nr:hypothetical protein [Anaerolineales bacterium]